MYFFTASTLEAKFDGVNWTNFIRDTAGDINCEYAIPGNGPMDRMGQPGVLTFSLRNSKANSAGLEGYYTPGHPNCRSGFAAGLEVRVAFTLDGLSVQKWTGIIPADGIQSPTTIAGNLTRVTVKDWFFHAGNHLMSGFPFAQDKTLMEAVPLILANMDLQPPGTPDYATGESTFAYVGDTITSQTTALAELAKLVQSELGYCYLTRFGLRVEGRLTRNDELVNPNEYPVARSLCDLLANEDDDFICNENGDYILLSDAKTAYFQNNDVGMVVSYGRNYYNSVDFECSPRRIDSSATTELFNLNSPMEIEAGETVVIKGKYKDPTGVAKKVSGIDMVDPVGGTHYTGNTAKDGTGSNITSDIDVVAVFGTGDFKYTITNNNASDGWITMCKAVGKGVYTDEPVSYHVEDTAAIAKHGIYPLTVQMKCQDDPYVVARYANISLYQYGQLKNAVDQVSYVANTEEDLLYAFLYLEPGMLIRLKKDSLAIDQNYFIQGVKFTLSPGKIVKFTWYVRDAGLDVFRYAKWTLDDTPVAGYGAWDDSEYGWDF